jgi:hypothetical protein
MAPVWRPACISAQHCTFIFLCYLYVCAEGALCNREYSYAERAHCSVFKYCMLQRSGEQNVECLSVQLRGWQLQMGTLKHIFPNLCNRVRLAAKFILWDEIPQVCEEAGHRGRPKLSHLRAKVLAVETRGQTRKGPIHEAEYFIARGSIVSHATPNGTRATRICHELQLVLFMQRQASRHCNLDMEVMRTSRVLLRHVVEPPERVRVQVSSGAERNGPCGLHCSCRYPNKGSGIKKCKKCIVLELLRDAVNMAPLYATFMDTPD